MEKQGSGVFNDAEPLPIKETVDPGAAENSAYVQLWGEDENFAYGASNGATPETVTDEPIKRSLSEVREDLANSRSSKSGRKNSASDQSGKRKASSKKNSRKNVSASYSLSEAQSNGGHVMPTDDVPIRNDSRRRLPDLPPPRKKSNCQRPSKPVIIAVVIVVILLVLGAILAAIFRTQGCKQSFEKFPDKFATGGKIQIGVRSADACASVCLEDPWCGGYGFHRVKAECYTMTGAVDNGFLLDSTTTDHYTRTKVCNKTDGEPIVCAMVLLKQGFAEGGVEKGELSVAECKQLCLEERGCIGIDHNKQNKKCYIHAHNEKSMNDACCEHYGKSCQRCKYTQEENTHTSLGYNVDHINTTTECGSYCDQQTTCTAFEFEILPKLCHIILNDDIPTVMKDNVVLYRKGECKDNQEIP